MNFPLNTPSMEQNNVVYSLLVSSDALHLWKLVCTSNGAYA